MSRCGGLEKDCGVYGDGALSAVLRISEFCGFAGSECPVGVFVERQPHGGCEGVNLEGFNSARELRPRWVFGRKLEGCGAVLGVVEGHSFSGNVRGFGLYNTLTIAVGVQVYGNEVLEAAVALGVVFSLSGLVGIGEDVADVPACGASCEEASVIGAVDFGTPFLLDGLEFGDGVGDALPVAEGRAFVYLSVAVIADNADDGKVLSALGGHDGRVCVCSVRPWHHEFPSDRPAARIVAGQRRGVA